MTETVRPAVRAVFRSYSEKHEGRTRNPYVDVKGLVTVSVGVLIDPFPLALALDWRIDTRKATPDEVRRDWLAVKSIGKNNRTASSQAPLTEIRLTDSEVDSLLWRRLNANAEWLRAHLFPEFPTYPADAQLAILSAAWGLGCDFLHTEPPRPELVRAVADRDWLAAEPQAKLRESGNKGVVNRNLDQELCFENAAVVEGHGLDPAILWWPKACPAPAPAAPPKADPVGKFVSKSFNDLLDGPSLGGAAAMREHDESNEGEP